MMKRVRIGTGDHVHPQFPAAFQHFAKGIVIGEELAAVMERDFGGVEGDATAG